ncbi:hydantoinase B/oxoprolinase family protein [Pseudomonas fluorescens]|uniref:hydantoinase B/oxoprolinase family protein n=1 Tax=Pseudomonas TaxID=286 RepID=UPI000DD35C06|nr:MULTISPECIES: hydantoinase B/oxoprolinase family protein [Pseudomonas]KAE9651280.1 hydantoinase B/oxoprolinase family protein [Pseudomonas sp. PB105]MBD8190486.1 hydantoinase B/oxoprolinase family protein [Pseudomonas fluorescens]MBD8225112.1 hydantoinase B/oxoprolinase family protein [Pseudomonas fluorescens]MBD8783430.1 hydantoinase B/oxoprolinase family protein [Pseudomonas fluorescens]MBD8815657.1 hydantoinase B/oxoprolinase family protein [Pseudomonas fluorescens]
MHTLDIFTRDIIQNSLQAIADEMFAAMRKAAMSPVIYEVLDMGTGITDANGEIASSGAGIPAFVGVLDKAVKQILLQHSGPDDIQDGDVFICNDPHSGAVTHLNDVVLAMPVFAEGRRVAWTANIAHWNDVGGMVPGSLSTQATDIFQEGLRLCSVKLISRGQPIRSVLQILRANTRMPDFMEGDLWAGVAAVRGGALRLRELTAKYGTDLFLLAMQDFMDLGEKVSRKALIELPNACLFLEEPQDDGSLFKVTVQIHDHTLTIDLRDNPDQCAGPTNLSRDGTVVAAQMAFKALTAPQGITNGGTFRPLTVLTRPGSLFDAQSPAAEGFYFENLIRVHDLILRCLAQQFPNRLPAGNFASVCATIIGGRHPDTGRVFTLVEPEIGGWGAEPGRDGNNAVYSGLHGETYNCPVEVCEARYGLYVERMALNDEPGGHGQFRGGRGICIDYRVRADGSFLTCGYTRSVVPPWGLQEGLDGTPNYVEVLRGDHPPERYAMASGVPLNAGDLVRVRTGAGGGYGPPAARDPAAVRDDLKNGYLDEPTAYAVYGVMP